MEEDHHHHHHHHHGHEHHHDHEHEHAHHSHDDCAECAAGDDHVSPCRALFGLPSQAAYGELMPVGCPFGPLCSHAPPHSLRFIVSQEHHHHHHHAEHHHHGEGAVAEEGCEQCAAGDADHAHHHKHTHKHDSRVTSVGIECEGEAGGLRAALR